MKLLANRHIGILVHDLDSMIDFYIGLGMVLKGYGRMIEQGKFIDTLLNSKGCVLETAKLTIEDDNLPEKYWFVLELILLQNNKSSIDTSEFNITRIKKGVLDIAFTVDDINTVSNYIVGKGGKLIGGPIKAHTGYPALHCYLQDIEGNVLHIAQNITD